jgi:hypothetical protein
VAAGKKAAVSTGAIDTKIARQPRTEVVVLFVWQEPFLGAAAEKKDGPPTPGPNP